MLNVLRKEKIRKGIFWFIAVAVIASFAISGVLVSDGGRDTSAALAKLDKRNISVRDYLDSYRAVQHQIDLFYGGQNIDRSRINIKGEAWDRLLLLDEAKNRNIRVSDKEIVEWITTQPAFKNKEVFDNAFYQMYIERGLRTTPRQFEEEIRQMLIIRKLTEKLSDELGLTDEKIKQLYIEQKTEKDIQLAILDKGSFTAQVKATDAEIEELFAEVKDQLSSPEKIKLKYIYVPKEKAESLKEALADKTSSLDELSKKYSLEIKETSLFSLKDTPAELKNAPAVTAVAFGSEIDKNIDWLISDAGQYKIQVVEKQAEHLMDIVEGRAELERMFAEKKAGALALQKLIEIKPKITNPDDFEKILKEEKLEVTTVEKYKKGMYPAGIWPSDGLEKAAPPLQVNGISEPFEVPKGAAIIKVTKVHGYDDKKFAEEKETFTKDIKSQKTQEETEKLLEKLREKLSLDLELLKDIFPADSGS